MFGVYKYNSYLCIVKNNDNYERHIKLEYKR